MKRYKVCPRCKRIIVSAVGNNDFVHECNGQSATLNNEDVPKVHKWEDYTGSGTYMKSDFTYGALPNKVQSFRGVVIGEKDSETTKRGNRVGTTRTRQHLEYIEFKDGCD